MIACFTRVSMALGLEVRVPYCDHRLVDYVLKSILRAAIRALLPASILQRQKNPYPSTQDPRYEKAVRAEVAEILRDPSHPATPLFNRKLIEEMLARPLQTTSSVSDRVGLERVRWIGAWVKDYGVVLDL